ncbi:hypothetical protein HQO90_07370 [Rhodococcus fascians]|nr:hypothetical protein [Rhodococcus fascians]
MPAQNGFGSGAEEGPAQATNAIEPLHSSWSPAADRSAELRLSARPVGVVLLGCTDPEPKCCFARQRFLGSIAGP